MAVQKSRKTPSKRGMHRSHDGLTRPALSIDPQSGETHLRHRITPDGFVTTVFRQPVLVLSMIQQDGNLLVGTGSEGLSCDRSLRAWIWRDALSLERFAS